MAGKNSRTIDNNDNERVSKRIKLEEADSSETNVNGSSSLSKTFLTKTGKVRRSIRTPQERCLELLQDPRIGAAQPHQVFCRMCGNWVKLFNHTEYVAANWIAHAKRCRAKTDWDLKVKAEPDSTFDLSIVGAPDSSVSSATLVENVPGLTIISLKEVVKEEVIEVQTKSTAKSLERRQLALDDERVAEAEPHKILCKLCSSWVRLHPAREFDLWNWHKHVVACEKKKVPPEELPEVDLKRKRKSRTMTERIQAFQDDPYCGEVRPNEAFCSICQRWIRLHKDVPYVDSNWHRHVNKCKIKPGDSSSSKIVVKPEPEIVLTSEVLQPRAKPQRQSGKTDEERRQELQADSRISIIEPYRVQCKYCNKWIKLQSQRQYDAWNWKKHISSCESRHIIKVEKIDNTINLSKSLTANSSSNVTLPKPPPVNIHAWRMYDTATEDERQQHLLSDVRCLDVEPNRVTCLICNRSIGLHAKKSYSLSNWYKHITACENSQKSTTPGLDESGLDNEELVYPDFESSSTLVEDSELAQGSSKRPKLHDESVTMTDVKINMSREDKTNVLVKRESRKSALNNSHGQQDTQPQSDIVLLDGPPALTARQKRTKEKADAREYKLRRDDRLSKIEPDRVFCKMCSKWIKLQHRLPYDSSNWLAHAKKCEIKTGWPSKKKDDVDVENATVLQMKLEPEVIDLTNCLEFWVKSEEQTQEMHVEDPIITGQPVKLLTLCDTCHSLIESNTESQHMLLCRRITTTSPEKVAPNDIDSRREAELRADPRAAIVERGKVLCRLCSTWIRLQQVHSFLPGNWLRHVNGCEKRNKQALCSEVDPQQSQEEPQATHVGEPLLGLELESEDEITPSSRHVGAFGSVELGELVDGYQPCFSSMDIQTKSPQIVVSKQPAPPKRVALERQPTRRSLRKLPNAGSFIENEIKKEEIIDVDELALKENNTAINNTITQPTEILPIGESRPYSYKNYISEPKNITIPLSFKPVEWSRSEEDEEEAESRPGSSASNKTNISSTESRPEKKSLNKKAVPPLTSPFTRTALTPRPFIPIPYFPTTLSKSPYIGKYNTHLVPVNLAYGPMALGARIMRN